MILYGLITVGLGYMVTYTILPVISKMLVSAEFVRPNFRGELIPLGVGVVFVLAMLATGSVWLLLYPEQAGMTLLFVFAAFAMTLLGFIDDVFGSREASGLKGHFKKLLMDGELTTGGLKALAGGMVALAASIYIVRVETGTDLIFVMLNALIIAFSTNAINLLDLRPGRAIKGYLVLAAILLPLGYRHVELWLLAFLTGAVLAYMPYDLKARTMMGDTGSNVLGVSIGITAVLVLPPMLKLVYFFLLIAFHIYTEKVSLTSTIERNKLLKYIDMIGRDN